jgi:hypothetical protein
MFDIILVKIYFKFLNQNLILKGSDSKIWNILVQSVWHFDVIGTKMLKNSNKEGFRVTLHSNKNRVWRKMKKKIRVTLLEKWRMTCSNGPK